MISSIGFKICLFPTKTQEAKMFLIANHCRGIWNELLATAEKDYEENDTRVSLSYLEGVLRVRKSQEEFSWIKDIPGSCSSHVCDDLMSAYTRSFKSGFGLPKFKKKGKSKLSFYQRSDNIIFWEDYRVTITGVGRVKHQKSAEIPINFKFRNPRVSYDGKHWYLSFSVQGNLGEDREVLSEGIGIDIGLKEFGVISNGSVLKNYNNDSELVRLSKKLKTLQRVVSRKYEVNKIGNKFVKTNNILKLEKKIRLLQRHISDIKHNYLHHYSSSLVKTKPEFIAVESLDVKGMKEADSNLSKEIQKVSWYEFVRQLDYKCGYFNIPFVKVDRYFPSTKKCSCCGNIQDIGLKERIYYCTNCGAVIDRDLNASINIRDEGKRLLAS